MFCEQLNIISVKLIIICAACTAPRCYNDVLTLYCLIIVKSKDFSDLSAKCVSYDTVSYLFAYAYTKSVCVKPVILNIHHNNTVRLAAYGVVNTAIFTVFLD